MNHLQTFIPKKEQKFIQKSALEPAISMQIFI